MASNILCFVIVLLASKHPSADAHEDMSDELGMKTTLIFKDNEYFLHKGLNDGIYVAADGGRKPIGARKMLGDDENHPKISGRGTTNNAPEVTSNGALSSRKPLIFNGKEEDSRGFVEAADDLVSLMRKDYKGPDRPRRKPPINNHKPTD